MGAAQHQQRLSFEGLADGNADIQHILPRGHVLLGGQPDAQGTHGSVAFHSFPDQRAQRLEGFLVQARELLNGQLRRAVNPLALYDYARGFVFKNPFNVIRPGCLRLLDRVDVVDEDVPAFNRNHIRIIKQAFLMSTS